MGERDFDLLQATLLKAAAKGWQALQFDVSLRYTSLKKDYTYDLSKMRSDVLPRDGNVDNIAEAIYPADGPENICPLKVYGDGNCFYRALSKAIFGHEGRHTELRVMTVLELVKNTRKYASQATYDKMCSNPPSVQYVVETSVSDRSLVPGNFLKSIQNETLSSIKSGEYCSLIHFFAVANALNHPIYSIYPTIQNVAVNRHYFHQEIRPLSDEKVRQGSPIYIMWSHTENSNPINWSPNHFVVCFSVLPTDVQTNEMKEPAPKKSKLCIDLDDTPEITLGSQNDKANKKSDDNEFIQTTEDEIDKDKTSIDDSGFSDLGKIVTGAIKLNTMSSAEKISYIQNQPLPDDIAKLKTGRAQTTNTGELKKTLSFQSSWMNQFPWLTFSKLLNGGLCKFCVMFPQSDVQHQNAFVTQPFTAYKKALGKTSALLKHQNSEHHKNAKSVYHTTKMTSEVPSSSLPYKLNQQNQTQYQHNIRLLEKIVDAVILCGKQNIPLRGHRDDSTSDSSNKGNFLAILQLLAKHDEQLMSHLQTAKKNALYTSKTIQNEVIQLIGNHITGKILKGLQGRGFYSIIADEVTDKYANKEVLVLCLRFLDTRENPATIKEEFLDFSNIGRTTGEAIADKLIEILRSLAIPIENMRGQAYDGAAAMASEKRGCQGRMKSLNQLALFTHCRSHVLNLSVASACKLPLVRNMIDVLNSVFIFFDSSPKRQGFFENIIENDGSVDFSKKKLVGLCKTRWVERHICFDVFYTMYKFVIKCLQHIINQNLDESTSEDWSWDRQTKVTAQGLLASLTSFSVLITFVFVRYVLDTIKPLTLKLQKRDIDIFTASKLIEEHVDRIKEIRTAVDTEFESCFEDAKQIADDLDIVIKIPRVCSKQQHRENVSTTNPKDYYRSVVAIPFLDFLLSELNSRFQKEDLVAYSICTLLPINMTNLSQEELSKLASELTFWESDLPCLSVKDLEKELADWKRYCVNMSKETSEKLCNLIFLFNFVNGDVFPNVKILLHIGCVLPITTCEAERSFSGLRRIKSYMRSTMQEDRLTGLALMHLHHSLEIDQKEIVQSFIRQGKRRLFQSSLFS